MTGDIANEHGDIEFSNGTNIASGRVALPTGQALRAILYGWHWTGTHSMNDGEWIVVQRGGERWEVRR